MHKKILITGGLGLIGSHLIEILSANKDLEIFTTSKKDHPLVPANVTLLNIDFSTDWNEDDLPEGLDTIIHLSQSEHFREFPNKAKEVFLVNTMSTMRLAEYAVSRKVNHFIYASSGGIYGNDEGGINESQDIIYKSELGFYLGTKQCSEIILMNYMKLLNVITLRFFFVYGKGQRKEMLIPRLVQNVQNGQPITLQGKEGMKMNPIHAYDAAKAIRAAMSLNGSHTINVAGPDVLSIRQIGEEIGKMVGKGPLFVENGDGGAKHLIGDISQMKKLLIAPSIHFAEGIRSLL